MTNDKDAGVLFNEDLFIYFKYHPETDTVEVWRNGELISSGSSGGVTPEQLYEILLGYVSKPELAEALLDYVTDEDLEDYVTDEQLISALASYVRIGTIASDETLGMIKTDSSQSITVDENGVLNVGGRLGQYTNGGVFYPTTIDPTTVGASSFMMTDGAKNLKVSSRTFGILAGANLTCKSAEAGTTQYHLTNNQNNRFVCYAGRTGRLAIDINDAGINGTAEILDISFANGNPISAYFGPAEADNDIIITVARTVNPDASTTKLRIYGGNKTSDVINVGQGCGTEGGKALALGQSCFAGGNQSIAFGNMSIVAANNSVAFGHTHLVNKQFCLSAGQGHDFTNASNGASALGIASILESDSVLAVGNGTFSNTSDTIRSNALEVKKDGSIIVPSTSGNKKFKITVDDNGTISATEII